MDKTFYLETYGCASNKADSFIISEVLKTHNYEQSKIEKAEFIIINTCTVKQQTENKIRARLKELGKKYHNRKLIVCGCLPFVTPEYITIIQELIPNIAAIVHPTNIHQIPQIIECIKETKHVQIFDEIIDIDKSCINITHRKDKITGIMPISEGCEGSCTYCCVKFARGKLRCFDPTTILSNIKNQLKQGIKQIYLTSQDCSNYGFNKITLDDLVEEITNLDFKFFLRLGMINPRFLIRNFNQIVSILEKEKVYQFLHIPFQSGSDFILKKMQRPYQISQITDKVELIRKKFPYLTLSTDIICGFPGESAYDFYKTINFVKWLRPEILNISKFTPRPGTKAKEMEQLDSKEIKNRSIRLTRVFRTLMQGINEKWQNWEGEVLILHKTKKENQVFGRNYAYKNVFVDNFKGKVGEFTNVMVYKVDGFNLFAVEN
jgi:MiaB-like tRNA modifying enzyme